MSALRELKRQVKKCLEPCLPPIGAKTGSDTCCTRENFYSFLGRGSFCCRCTQRICGGHARPSARYASKMNGNNLTIATKSGKEAIIPLKDGAPVIAVTKGAMSDIKSNTFVGITAMPQPDGTQKAVEVPCF